MNFKIIETGHSIPDVLLYRDRDADGVEIVNILAIGTLENSDNMFASEQIKFESPDSAQRFIADYSVMSAAKWCEKEGITY